MTNQSKGQFTEYRQIEAKNVQQVPESITVFSVSLMYHKNNIIQATLTKIDYLKH